MPATAQHYQDNLAGKSVPIHESEPRVGFYKRRAANGTWEPVAIWEKDGKLVCRVGGAMADPHEVWTWCADHPVSSADAKHAFKTGTWPGDAPPPIGHNEAPSDDPFEALTRELEAEQVRVALWIKEPHEGKTAADKAANWLVSLRKLEVKTISAFDAEKLPALEEARRIDGKWRGLKALAAKIKNAMADHYDAIARKERARLQAIADAEAKKAADEARAKWEADQAQQKRLASEHNIHIAPEEPPALPEPVAEPVKVAFGGATGSRIAPRSKPATASVSDWAKAAAHYSGSPKLREIIQRLANADAKNGVVTPGVTIIPGE
jgi:hypothetical protein